MALCFLGFEVAVLEVVLWSRATIEKHKTPTITTVKVIQKTTNIR